MYLHLSICPWDADPTPEGELVTRDDGSGTSFAVLRLCPDGPGYARTDLNLGALTDAEAATYLEKLSASALELAGRLHASETAEVAP